MSRRISHSVVRARGRATVVSAAAAALLPGVAFAHSGAPIPDSHAPAGVMVDHMHKAGEWMVGYRYGLSISNGDTLRGTRQASDHEIIENGCGHGDCMMKQGSMRMHMHMLDIMYAPTDWLTLMVMPMWMSMEMRMVPLEGGMGHGGGHGGHGGGHMEAHAHGTDGIGDTTFGALIKLSEGPGLNLHAGVMLSAPTGSVGEKNANGNFTHYMMQLGSGTWDLLPSLTYTGRAGLASWGAQVSGAVRLESENESGYKLGDVFQTTAWGAYRLLPWLSASLRVLYTRQGEIDGHYNGPHGHGSPPDLQYNYGGKFVDVGFGVNAVVPDGMLKGHRLSVEWLEPVYENVNGYQQEREGTLWVNWSKAF